MEICVLIEEEIAVLLIAKRRKANERMNWELEIYLAIANVNLSAKILILLVFVVICG